MKNLNKDIKIFFIDLDGTLLDDKDENNESTISKENIREIENVFKSKKHVVISTGRYGDRLLKYMKLANVQYAVAANGAFIVDKNGKVYKDDKLTIRQVLLLVEFAKKHKLSLKIDESWKVYGVKTSLQKIVAKKYGFTSIEHYNCDMQKEYPKIIFFGKVKHQLKKLISELKNTIEGLSVVTSAKGYTIEITNEKSTKGIGNLQVAKMLNITSRREMVHIGDTMNDSTTIEYMRFIAMGNSEKKLKNMTKFIGPSYKKGGVAKILRGEYTEIE